MPTALDHLARSLVLGALLDELTTQFGGYELVAHWTQGEFHHDIVLRLPDPPIPARPAPIPPPSSPIPAPSAGTAPLPDPPIPALPGRILVVATNCNGGIKEVLCFHDLPDRRALWHHRCPTVDAFDGDLAPILASATTEHWFDPCELLAVNARSELRPEHRRRQEGGGWEYATPTPGCPRSSKP
jgi:hypothetical protein